jgi:pimeloyl-ACP methyl ester carboxylesterase
MSAGFEVLEDNTVRARFSRANHIAVIEAMWEHRPSVLYPSVKCPVLLMPARRAGDEPAMDMAQQRDEALSRAERLFPLSKTVWLEDSVHDVPLQRPGLVAKVIANNFHDGLFKERHASA